MYDGKKVINGRYERLIRTISFALILLTSFIMGIKAIVNIDWAFVQNIFDPINSFLNNEIGFINDYLLLMLLVGFLGLIWTQSRNLFARIITTILLVVVAIINDNVTQIKVFGFIPKLSFINDLLDNLLANNNWLLLVIQIIPLLFVYFILNARKPKRMSLNVLLSGIGFLMLRLVLNELPVIIGNDWLTRNGYILMLNINLVVSYGFLAVGSTLGIIGFFRK